MNRRMADGWTDGETENSISSVKESKYDNKLKIYDYLKTCIYCLLKFSRDYSFKNPF